MREPYLSDNSQETLRLGVTYLTRFRLDKRGGVVYCCPCHQIGGRPPKDNKQDTPSVVGNLTSRAKGSKVSFTS